jgi:hypothetical protein
MFVVPVTVGLVLTVIVMGGPEQAMIEFEQIAYRAWVSLGELMRR